MKALPEAVQAAFPCEAGTVRERPWWYKSRHGVSGADCLRRSDDPHTTAPTVEDAAAHDVANPLPHPGLRAGQVWAHESGESIVILRAISTRVWASDNSKGDLPSEFARIYPYLMADPACPWLAPWSPAEVKP